LGINTTPVGLAVLVGTRDVVGVGLNKALAVIEGVEVKPGKLVNVAWGPFEKVKLFSNIK